jgi:integrase
MKAGAEVATVLPDRVVAAFDKVKPGNGAHPGNYFSSGIPLSESLRANRLARIRFLRDRLKFTDEEGRSFLFHSHQLRDTFAVELLLAGCPLEKVSKLLTHESIRVTEKHQAPWLKQRLLQLIEDHVEFMKKMGATFTAAA